MIKAVIFDVDGTLLDSLDDITASVNHTMRALGYPVHTREAVRGFIGHGYRWLIRCAVPGGTEDPRYEEALAAFFAHYADHCADTTRPFPGVPALIARLHAEGYRIAASSNKGEDEVRLLMDKWFPGCFDAIAGTVPGRPTKPAPDGLFYILETLSLRPEEAVYAGDSETDIETAAAGGLPCVSVTWGFRDRDALLAAGAARLVDTPAELYGTVTGKRYG